VSKPSAASAVLVAVHTAALLVALYLWIPLYRRLVAGPGGDHPGQGQVWKFFVVILVMQACYWGRRRLPSNLAAGGVLTGHVLLFLSRLAFVFVGSSFTLFIVRMQDTTVSPQGVVVSILALFAIFCYVLELEQMARPRLEHAHHA
jgi:hypothetical protein